MGSTRAKHQRIADRNAKKLLAYAVTLNCDDCWVSAATRPLTIRPKPGQSVGFYKLKRRGTVKQLDILCSQFADTLCAPCDAARKVARLKAKLTEGVAIAKATRAYQVRLAQKRARYAKAKVTA